MDMSFVNIKSPNGFVSQTEDKGMKFYALLEGDRLKLFKSK